MTIALISPSSPTPGMAPQDSLSDLATKLSVLTADEVVVMPHAGNAVRFLAGADEERAADIMAAFSNPQITAIMTVRGGYGSARVLDRLDYDTIRRHPKPVLGFSDATALQNALFARAGITGYSGFQAGFLQTETPTELQRACLSVLAGQPVEHHGLIGLTHGTATGVMIGGTLSVFCGLLGTPYYPDVTNKIIVLEDVGEEPYVLDRLLTQLRLAGVWEKAAGVALGDFTDCVAKDPADGTVSDVLQEHFGTWSKPVIRIPYGHRTGRMVVPIGKRVLIDADQGILKEL